MKKFEPWFGAPHCDTCKTGAGAKLEFADDRFGGSYQYPYRVYCICCGKSTSTHTTEEAAKCEWHDMTDVEAPL